MKGQRHAFSPTLWKAWPSLHMICETVPQEAKGLARTMQMQGMLLHPILNLLIWKMGWNGG